MRLNLEDTWKYCMAMWRSISRKCCNLKLPEDSGERGRLISQFKKEWLEKNGFGKCIIDMNCFFCEYVSSDRSRDKGCNSCPAVKIDADFHCNPVFIIDGPSWWKDPCGFYQRLRILNKKRLKR